VNQTEEMHLDFDLEEAKRRVVNALIAVGTVVETAPTHVDGQVRHGLQRVKVRIAWAAKDKGTRLVLQGSSDDFAGVGAKSALERVEAAIKFADVPGFVPDRAGAHPAVVFGSVCAVVVLVVLVLRLLF
jgi:hypothetical protein